jgi:hypothetical protein
MFHILEREMQWRREQGLNEGFEALRAFKPVIAVGAEDPLEAQKMLADYFRTYLCGKVRRSGSIVANLASDGRDGLGGIHASVSPTPTQTPTISTSTNHSIS